MNQYVLGFALCDCLAAMCNDTRLENDKSVCQFINNMYIPTIFETLTGICINASELAACEQEVEKKQQELYYARTTIVNISRVDINLGSSWQFTNSSFNSVVTVVKVENHLGENPYIISLDSISNCAYTL